jgi:hypothetical protein
MFYKAGQFVEYWLGMLAQQKQSYWRYGGRH